MSVIVHTRYRNYIYNNDDLRRCHQMDTFCESYQSIFHGLDVMSSAQDRVNAGFFETGFRRDRFKASSLKLANASTRSSSSFFHIWWPPKSRFPKDGFRCQQHRKENRIHRVSLSDRQTVNQLAACSAVTNQTLLVQYSFQRLMACAHGVVTA